MTRWENRIFVGSVAMVMTISTIGMALLCVLLVLEIATFGDAVPCR